MNKVWLLALTLIAGQSMAALHGKDVSYSGGGVKMKGYVVYDDQFKGKRPAVLVVHEWWGLNDYARSRADQLAKAGYVAMAVDMYGDGKHANHPDNAMAFMQEATKNTEQTSARFRAAEKLLKANKHSDSQKLAAKLQGGAVFDGSLVAGNQIATQIFKLNFENANNLLPILRPLISPNNTINVNPGNNSLVITDYGDNLRRIAQIIAAMGV